MTINGLKNWVDRQQAFTRDSGLGTKKDRAKAAREMRDEIFADVLREIAGGARHGRELAKEALRCLEDL
jgi:hypothetical protein